MQYINIQYTHTHTLDQHKDDDVHGQSEAEPLPITLQQNLFGQHL